MPTPDKRPLGQKTTGVEILWCTLK